MSCPYKREKNPKPILPKCQYNLRCTDYTHAHRFGFYHDTFGDDHEQRMNFLLKTAQYSLSKKKKDASFSPRYLWEQFSCDLKDETYHHFLIFAYLYVMDHTDGVDNLMTLNQAFISLEENAVTGIYYLNVAFMMLIFKKDSLTALEELLDQLISRSIIVTKYDISFTRLLEIINSIDKGKINPIVLELDEPQLKALYSEFMLSDRITKEGEIKVVWSTERKIMDAQIQLFPDLPAYTISNTGLTMIITALLRKNGYTGAIQTGHFY
jgi:hypothetical protein